MKCGHLIMVQGSHKNGCFKTAKTFKSQAIMSQAIFVYIFCRNFSTFLICKTLIEALTPLTKSSLPCKRFIGILFDFVDDCFVDVHPFLSLEDGCQNNKEMMQRNSLRADLPSAAMEKVSHWRSFAAER